MLNDQYWGISIASGSGLSVAFVESSHEVLLGDEGDGDATGEVRLDVHADLGGVSDESLSLDTGTASAGSGTDDSGVDSAGDTVVLLDVDLGHVEVLLVVRVVLLDISLGRGIDHVSHLESLDGLVLTDASSAVKASDDIGVSLVLLTASSVSSLSRHV